MLIVFRAVALAALVAVTFTSMAQAQVHSRLRGDTYTFSATNFPGDIGETEDPVTREIYDHGTAPVQLTFDGIEEVAGGMRVNERAVQFDGIDGGVFGVQASGIGDDGHGLLAQQRAALCGDVGQQAAAHAHIIAAARQRDGHGFSGHAR